MWLCAREGRTEGDFPHRWEAAAVGELPDSGAGSSGCDLTDTDTAAGIGQYLNWNVPDFCPALGIAL